MTQEQCSKRILKKFKQIEKIYRTFNPEGKYLTLSVLEDSIIIFNNEECEEKKIDIYVRGVNNE